jgi:uncharacterized protein YjbI with pentapeptide repeats
MFNINFFKRLYIQLHKQFFPKVKMSAQKCCFIRENPMSMDQSCPHDYYKSHDGKDYCVFHYPDVNDKREDLNRCFEELIKDSNENKDIEYIWLVGSVITSLRFTGEIEKRVDFSESEFKGMSDIDCEFKRSAIFNRCKFLGLTIFSKSRFLNDASFSESEFLGETLFIGCEFSRGAYYQGADTDQNNQRSKKISFSRCLFSGYASFSNRHFLSDVDFDESQFKGHANFHECEFNNLANFKKCRFFDSADFNKSHFSGIADFSEARFYTIGNFKATTFAKEHTCCLEFKNTNFTGADFNKLNLSGVDLANACLKDIKYNKKGPFKGTNAASCWGNMQFRRFAMDQAYIEELVDDRKSDLEELKKAKTTYKKKLEWLRTKVWKGFWLWFWKWSSDYGRNIWWWVAWSFGFAFVFAIIFYALGEGAFAINTADCRDITLDLGANDPGTNTATIKIQQLTGCKGLGFGFLTMFYYSIVTFTTLGFGDITPLTGLAAFFVVMEVITGYVMLGGLISILANKLARRAD